MTRPSPVDGDETASTIHPPEAVGLALGASLGDLLGVDEVARAPVALHEAPRPRHVHGVPRVAEA